MDTVKVMNDQEQVLLFKLLNDEFASKVIRNRKTPKVEGEHPAIISSGDCPCCDGKYYQLALPTNYVMFVEYLLDKSR